VTVTSFVRLGSCRIALCLLVASTATACQGVISSPWGESQAPVCNGSAPASDNPTPLPRLTRSAYLNVLADVVKTWAPAVAGQVMSAPAVTDAEGQLGPDSRVTGSSEKRGGFRKLDQVLGQDRVDATFAIAQAVAAELTSSPDRISALLGDCASDSDPSNDDACVQSFIQGGGRVAQRRALDTDDVDFYTSVYAAPGIDAAALADVITVMLTSPYLLYQVEHGGDVVDRARKVYALDGQELANRLSLQFWGTIPDAELTAMVDSGQILTEDGYAAAVAHVAAGPQMTDTLGDFYREYLSLEDLEQMDRLVGTPRYDAVRGSFTPNAGTTQNMIDEVTRLALYYTLKPEGTFNDLFTTTKSFATTADVAEIYGLPVWSGDGEPPEMPDGQHVGLLTHAGMVASGNQVTRPIIKGVIIRSVLLCDPIGAPPANAMMVAQNTQAMLDPLSSTRSLTQALTEQRGDCAGCHSSQINPLGFPTEAFDPLGRVRDVETVFDDAGNVLGMVPIDTTSVPGVIAGDASPVANAADLQAQLLASNRIQECFARKYFRFTFGQVEDAAKDTCTIRSVTDGLVQGQPLGQVLLRLTAAPAFRQRRFN
jgi:hypothetical protein